MISKSILSLLCGLSLTALVVNGSPIKADGKTFVVLVAGADTYDNYASSSSIYHAYQVAHANGIPDENIIVFHPDDIANNKLNPTPGKVIDHPGGPDVYKGVPKDYIGADNNAKNLISVLKGSAQLSSAGKKVLNSGPNDNVFIYYLGWGDKDQIHFPNNGTLTGEELNAALKDMHQNKRYNKLVFYLESGMSGSMFDKLLPTDINAYAITSSTPTTRSGPMYKDKTYHTYIGSFFAHYFLLNSETADLTKETLQQQFDYIAKETIRPGQVDADNFTQEAKQYGDLSIAKLTVSQFLGSKK